MFLHKQNTEAFSADFHFICVGYFGYSGYFSGKYSAFFTVEGSAVLSDYIFSEEIKVDQHCDRLQAALG